MLSLVLQDGSHALGNDGAGDGAAEPVCKSLDLADSDEEELRNKSYGLRSGVWSMEEALRTTVIEDEAAAVNLFWSSEEEEDIVSVDSKQDFDSEDSKQEDSMRDLSDSVDSMQDLDLDSVDSMQDPDSSDSTQDRPHRSHRFFIWPGPGARGFKLAKVYRHGRHVGWGATCARHWDDGVATCCKKQMMLGVAFLS